MITAATAAADAWDVVQHGWQQGGCSNQQQHWLSLFVSMSAGIRELAELPKPGGSDVIMIAADTLPVLASPTCGWHPPNHGAVPMRSTM